MFTVISKDHCPWCDKACELLTKHNKNYYAIEVSTRPGLNAAMRTIVKMAGFTTVPQVFDPEGNLIGGYEELEEHFDV